LQGDGVHPVGATCITAASLSTLIAGLPLESPVSGVHVGMKEDGSFFLNPTFEEAEKGKLDLIVAGTEDAIMMVEAGAQLISNKEMVAALAFAHEEIKKICVVQKEFLKNFNIVPREVTLLSPSELAEKAVFETLSDADFDSISGKTKGEIKNKIHALQDRVFEKYASQIESEEILKSDIEYFFEKGMGKSLRRRMFARQERIDGRALTEIRSLSADVHIFPRLHGSAIFQRGETQVFSVATVAGPREALLLNDAERNEVERFYVHHYNFPSYATGEVKALRGTNRREVGHGMLAERALRCVLLDKTVDHFPYMIRVVSDIMTCNGSSSMASVCGSTLALMDAGVPLKRPIAGIAMGLMAEEGSGKYEILTDIMSFEDFGGDMDFKVTGDDQGISALQLDIKLKGLKLSLLEEALEKAQVARKEILEVMIKTIPESRSEMSSFAPRIDSFHVDPEYIGLIIGKGGETIQRLCKEYSVDISIEDDGQIFITAVDQENGKAARKEIEMMVYEPTAGDEFDGVVKSVMDFGVFVEFMPGKEALVHVSEMSDKRVEHPGDLVQVGDTVHVKFLGTDKMGRQKLTMNMKTQPFSEDQRENSHGGGGRNGGSRGGGRSGGRR